MNQRLLRAALFLVVASPLSLSQAANMTGGELAEHCLSLCEVVGKEGLTVSDIAKPDQCAGYLKGVISAARIVSPPSQEAAIQACSANILGARRSNSPAEDPLLKSLCHFGRWTSERASMRQRGAAAAVLQWSGATRCDPER